MVFQLKMQTAGMEELGKILELQKICYQSEAVLYNDYTIQPLTQTIDELVDDFNGGTTYFSGYINGKLVASVRGVVNNGVAYINKLIVQPEFQNKGFGKLMMNTIEQKFRHADRFELFTGDKSEKNIRLYKKLGYKICRHKKVNESLTLVYMQKLIFLQ
ncbi:GNAT family N-acetyltransferase [Niabella aquatica]